MKKIVLLLIFIFVFVVGCNKEDHSTIDNSIFDEISNVDEVIVTKYLNDINDYECKYHLKGEETKSLIDVLGGLQGRKTASGIEQDKFKYSFVIGDLNICVANDFCIVNKISYRTTYNFDDFFKGFNEIKDDADILFNEIVSLDNVTKVDVTRIVSESKLKMFLRTENKVENFVEKMSVTKWKTIESINAALVYELKIDAADINVYKDNNSIYYISVNKQNYTTNGTLQFLDDYTPENTDSNSSGWLPWV